MQIISEIKVDGKWINQDDLPEEVVARIVAETICRTEGQLDLKLH